MSGKRKESTNTATVELTLRENGGISRRYRVYDFTDLFVADEFFDFLKRCGDADYAEYVEPKVSQEK